METGSEVQRGVDGDSVAVVDGHVCDPVAALLVARVQERLPRLTHVRFTTFAEDGRGRWDTATRRRVVTSLLEGAPAVLDGRRIVERAAERRWLAWFPRPFGPHHAINVAGPTVDWVAARVPTVRLVRGHLAARAWQAELVQATGTVAATAWGRRRLDAWVGRGGRTRRDVRWACVVEGTEVERELVRAWAWGRDPGVGHDRVTRRLAEVVAEGRVPAVWPPTAHTSPLPRADIDAGQARRVLDDLADAGVLQWSVTGPDPR